ncbi:MAG: ABC transporter ATP-binding protein [Thermoproteota archaeon]|jgi:peptide/nickel transport system ATP-binding protein
MYYEVYGGGLVKAVDKVSFTLNEHDSFGVVGESGCGKSSLASVLLRLLPTNAKIMNGRVLLEGVNILKLPEDKLRKEVRWKKIAMVFQGSMNALNPIIKVGDQIVEAIQVHENVPRTRALQRAKLLLEMVGLDSSVVNRYPFELSGGQRQRAVIAMALALNPKVLIADEPTTALDVIVQDQILKLLKRLQHELGMSLIFISHDISAVSEVSNRVAVMYAGKIVEMGSAEDVFLRPKHPYTQALMEAVPSIKEAKKELKSIPGSPPSLLDPPAGCRFHPRCPYATAICKQVEPNLIEVGRDHMVACHLVGGESSE